MKEGEVALMKEMLSETIPDLADEFVASETCMYTLTTNEDFLIDWANSENKTTLFLSPCSGHVFKMATAVGEIAADLCEKGETHFDVDFMKMETLEKELK